MRHQGQCRRLPLVLEYLEARGRHDRAVGTGLYRSCNKVASTIIVLHIQIGIEQLSSRLEMGTFAFCSIPVQIGSGPVHLSVLIKVQFKNRLRGITGVEHRIIHPVTLYHHHFRFIHGLIVQHTVTSFHTRPIIRLRFGIARVGSLP